MARSLILVLAFLLSAQSGCIWKLWSKGPPVEERVFDLYGTVQSITPDRLVIQAKGVEQSFRIGPSSIKGSDFDVGAYVHVYYQLKEDIQEVTMVVEKVD